MPARPASTLLFVGATRLARADFDGAGRMASGSVRASARTVGGELVDLVRAAIGLGGPCGARVWLLAEELWTQTLVLPTPAVQDLARAHLEQALRFEAEPLSGLPAAEAALGFVELGAVEGTTGFWVTQVRAGTLDALRDAVQAAKGRLESVLHSGGLGAPLDPAAAQGLPWCRLESWHQVMLRIGGGPGGTPGARMLNAGVGQTRVGAGVQQWIASAQARHWEWLGDDAAATAEVGWRRFHLEHGEALEAWLSAWGLALSAGGANVPAIRPPVKPLATRVLALSGVAAAAVAILLCAGHAWWVAHKGQFLEAELRRLEAPLKQLKEKDAEIEKLAKEVEKLAHENREGILRNLDAAAVLTRSRRQLHVLLDLLARHTPQDLVVERFTANPSRDGEVTVSGMALNPALADLYSERLATALGPHGWVVHPATKDAKSGEGLCVFKLVLAAAPTAAAPAASRRPSLPPGATP